MGYRLVRSLWGRGYATEGSRALVDKAFTDLGVERVVATTMTINLGSRGVMEKVGLTLVRTFHESWPDPIDGAEHGDVEYALSKAEWERRRAAAAEPCVVLLRGPGPTSPSEDGIQEGRRPRSWVAPHHGQRLRR